MLKTISIILGLAAILAGILGFIPTTAPYGYLLGIIHINLAHNLLNLAIGIFALWMGLQGYEPARNGLRLLTIIYAALTILGFMYGDKDLLGIIANNAAATWIHLALTAITLYLGFFYQERYAKA